MSRRRWLLLFFLVTTVLVGFLYWRGTDWWAYRPDPTGPPVPKFEMPPLIQFSVSAVVGAFAGGLLTAIVFGASEVWAAWKGRGAQVARTAQRQGTTRP